MTGFKEFCKDFPTQGGIAVVSLILIFFTGVAVIGRLGAGQPFPDGYEPWLVFLGALATGTFAGMIGKRLSDFRYKQAGTSPVSVGGPSTVTVTNDPASRVAPDAGGVGALPAPAPPVTPDAAEIRAALEHGAARQRGEAP
jgi:hypothetical protein